MIGVWQKFGEGEPPYEGEPLVYVTFQHTSYSIGPEGRVVAAIYRYGVLTDQDGSSGGIPYGAFWTSLPPPP